MSDFIHDGYPKKKERKKNIDSIAPVFSEKIMGQNSNFIGAYSK